MIVSQFPYSPNHDSAESVIIVIRDVSAEWNAEKIRESAELPSYGETGFFALREIMTRIYSCDEYRDECL